MTCAEDKNTEKDHTHKRLEKKGSYISAASLKSLVNCNWRVSS